MPHYESKGGSSDSDSDDDVMDMKEEKMLSHANPRGPRRNTVMAAPVSVRWNPNHDRMLNNFAKLSRINN